MGEEVKLIVQKLPVLNKQIILKKNVLKGNLRPIRLLKPAFKEELLFETEKCDFLPGEYRKVRVVNRQYYANNTVRTVAKIENNSGTLEERTSDELVKLIGQANYVTVFSSISSVFNQELKIRGILSLLTVPKKSNSTSTQVDLGTDTEKVEKSSQTSASDYTVKPIFRRKRQVLSPYVVKDEPDPKIKKVIIKPDDFKKYLPDFKIAPDKLPELGSVFDENSNDSIGNLSSLSITTTPELLKNPSTLLDNVDKHTKNNSKDVLTYQNLTHQLPVSTSSISTCTADSMLQTASRTILSQTMPEQLRIFRLQQASNDWKNCLQRDEDGYLPIHIAVLNNDLNLLRRQCIILKIRNETVDIPATGSLTALKMSLIQDHGETTAMLLRFGADPLAADEDNRTSFHIAAEQAADHMQALVHHCRLNAKNILHDEDLWKPEFETKSEEELSSYLFDHITKVYDSQGYTPLMLASKIGNYTNVRRLVELAPNTVNTQTPNSGNTALYLAVGAACMDSAERGNKAKVADNYRQTIEILLENGADPSVTNFSNLNVNDLVTEYTCSELSMLIANKLTAVKFMPGESYVVGKNFDSYMLLKEKDGKVNLIDMVNNRNVKHKPVIVANELYAAGTRDARKSPEKLTIHLSKNLANFEQQPSKSHSIDTSKNAPKSSVAVVKKIKLNKPLIIQTQASNNKRKIAIATESETQTKKINNTDT